MFERLGLPPKLGALAFSKFRPFMFSVQRPLLVVFLALTYAATAFSPSVQAATNDLGISINILPADNHSKNQLANNNKLWFVIAPKESGSRDFLITSASSVRQSIHMEVGSRVSVNGTLQLEPGKLSPVDSWSHFSINDFILAPHESKQVSLTIQVPADSPTDVVQPALLVQAKSVTNESIQYKIRNTLQFSQGIFLGVGTTAQFVSRFSIDDVASLNDPLLGHVLVIKLNNSGKTPVAPLGFLKLSNLRFEGQTLGPFNFISDTIAPGKTANITIPVPETVTEDRYRIYVEARQGQIKETRTFEQDISFKGTNYLQLAITSSIIILISLAVLMFAIRTLRSIKLKQLEEQRAKDEAEAERIAEAARVAELERQLAEMQAALAKPKPRRKPATKAKTKPETD